MKAKMFLFASLILSSMSVSAQRNEYSVQGNRVLYNGRAITYADSRTFQILGYGYAKDRHNVYLDGNILNYVDPDGFRLYRTQETAVGQGVQIGERGHNNNQPVIGERGHGNNSYNGNSSYPNHHHGEMYNPVYVVNNFDVIFDGKKVSGASASSFKDLGYGYGKDAFSVYYYGEKIPSASGSSFVLLNDGYSKDAFNVYYRNKKITGSSGNSFKVLTDGYGKDAFSVYFFGEKVSGASSNTFKVDKNGYAHDSFNTYYYGKKVK